MRLSSEKLGSILEQIDAEVIPDDHPSLPKLREVKFNLFFDDNYAIYVAPSCRLLFDCGRRCSTSTVAARKPFTKRF